ncbi:MAG: hypothetical protein K9W46_08880 [Candidatus Heimdallarchaeum endolithica]|uniref:DNA-directed RNA polymerase M/15kDa subunit domain-containing protein n=1 Tax=Candidatus Heimdallarchaeum endolithica TaxID=2876572 RepID=A0A9Y1FMW8_9ARCH|nr:MAG: hypothetical protein K9W46_08880 [Candidatus Heimdallarchaeum endolithica]
MNNSSDDYSKAGADILLKGGKMLNKACPKCYSPLYEYGGKIICVKCKQEYVLVDEKSKLQQRKQMSSNQVKSQYQISQHGSNITHETLLETQSVIMKKLSQLNKQLEISENIDEIISINNAIKSLLETLNKLK